MTKFIISLFIFSSLSFTKECLHPQNMRMEQQLLLIKSYYFLFFNGAKLNCNSTCVDSSSEISNKDECLVECQNKAAQLNIEEYFKTQYGPQYKDCNIWDRWATLSQNL